MIFSKKQYLKGFGIVVILLALVRCIFPSVAENGSSDIAVADTTNTLIADTINTPLNDEGKKVGESDAKQKPVPIYDGSGKEYDGSKHPIIGVISYKNTFPDSNDVQLEVAKALGVTAVRDRDEAEQRKNELVYVAASPYYDVAPLKNSIPYLVPRAAVLLNDIGRIFFDSLYVKHLPFHKFVVTSVMRSQEDLDKLKKVNRNVSENSCHLYGTTFDIGYNRYQVVADPKGPEVHEVRNDTLKWVLSEVLRDMREQGRCYVKYEVKQGCYHITVR